MFVTYPLEKEMDRGEIVLALNDHLQCQLSKRDFFVLNQFNLQFIKWVKCVSQQLEFCCLVATWAKQGLHVRLQVQG